MVDKNHVKEQRKVSEQEYAKSEQQYLEAEIEQEKALSSTKSPVKALVNAFTAPVGFKMFEVEADNPIARECHEEKLRELRRKAIQDIAEIAKRMNDCTDNSELTTVAIDALQQAMGGLQKLLSAHAANCHFLGTASGALRDGWPRARQRIW